MRPKLKMEIHAIDFTISAKPNDDLRGIPIPSVDEDHDAPFVSNLAPEVLLCLDKSAGELRLAFDGRTRLIFSQAQCLTLLQFRAHLSLVIESIAVIKRITAFASNLWDIRELPRCLESILKHCRNLHSNKLLQNTENMLAEFQTALATSLKQFGGMWDFNFKHKQQSEITERKSILAELRETRPTFKSKLRHWDQFLTNNAPGVPNSLKAMAIEHPQYRLPLKTLQMLPQSAMELRVGMILEARAIEKDVKIWEVR